MTWKKALALLLAHTTLATCKQSPQVTVVLVIDGFAQEYLKKLQPHLRYGFKRLLENGAVYTNAHVPHAISTTAPGHTTLATGTYPKNHGIIANSWYSGNDKIKSTEVALATQTFSDSFAETHHANNRKTCVASISLKDRAALPMAGSAGTVITFDKKTGLFTTPNKPLDKQNWLKQFNEHHQLLNASTLRWSPAYPRLHRAYQHPFINLYDFARGTTMINQVINRNQGTLDKFYRTFYRMPQANQTLLDLGIDWLKNNQCAVNQAPVLLWLSLSSLDKICHLYGPHSKEAIDMIYHLDRQLEKFIKQVESLYGKNNTLFVLSADHGAGPIPEIMTITGYQDAYRIQKQDIKQAIITALADTDTAQHALTGIAGPQLYFNEQLKDETLSTIKKSVEKIPGFAECWTRKEIKLSKNHNYHAELFNNHLFGERLGDIVCALTRFSIITNNKGGSKHNIGYDYNTRVPVIFYGNTIKHTVVPTRVDTTQIAPTLAQLLNIPKPNGCTSTALPGIV